MKLVEYKCKHCNKSFKQSKTVKTHKCVKRDRIDKRHSKDNVMAYELYCVFYARTTKHRSKTYHQFANSNYFVAFHKFALYCIDNKVINAVEYMHYLLDKTIPLDRWPRDSVYNKFVSEYIYSESVTDALERTIEYIIKWSDITKDNPYDFFRNNSPNAICRDISFGRVSPWVVYKSSSGIDFLTKLNDSQMSLVWSYINPERWEKKFKLHQSDAEFASTILDEGGY